MNRILLAAALAALPVFAIAQAPHPGPGAAQTDSDRAFMAAHQKMMEHMTQLRPTGNADRDFVAMMIPHHQGAIDMARVELQFGKDPELRKLAEKIIADQEREIAEMRGWQKKTSDAGHPTK